MEVSANNALFYLGQSAIIFLAVVICSFLLVLGIGYALHQSRLKALRREQAATAKAERADQAKQEDHPAGTAQQPAAQRNDNVSRN